MTEQSERHTSPEAASAAGKVLRNEDASPEDKTAAASALSQTPNSDEDDDRR